MEAELYQRMDAIEGAHWWFRGRRRILEAMIRKRLQPKGSLDILEAGAGTGGNISMLQSFGTVAAFEPDAGARELANRKGYAVEEGFLPGPLPFTGECFDLILLADVLEHVEADLEALVALRQCLRPGGSLLLTVPAFPFLWSAHDERHQHFRRYRRQPLLGRLEAAGFAVPWISYYNCWLFPPIAAVRALHRLCKRRESDEESLPAPPLNRFLEGLFASERGVLASHRLPFGVSLIAHARLPLRTE